MKRSLVFSISILLAVGFLYPANATTKSGSVCRELGKTSTAMGKKYVCVKTGKKLTWKLFNAKKATAPVVTDRAPVQSPVVINSEGASESESLKTEALPLPQSREITEGKSCSKPSWPVVGYLLNGEVGYVICAGPPGSLLYQSNNQWLKTDAKTRAPIISKIVPEFTLDTRQPHAYIYPVLSSQKPKTEISDRSTFSNTAPCQLQEEIGARSNSNMGFPIKNNRVKLDDRVLVQVIPVDFVDVRADSNPADDLIDALSAIEKFWERQASKKVDIVFQIPQAYIHLNKNVLDYKLDFEYSNFAARGNTYFQFANEVAALIDGEVDFSQVDIAIVAGPPAIKDAQIGTFVAQKAYVGDPRVMQTREKVIENFLIRGHDENRDIFNWIHEFGHMFGLTDFGHDGWADVSQNPFNSGKGFFDIMTSYRAPELYVWHRFLLGILEENQIDCVIPNTKSTHFIRPVASSESVQKGVIVPLSSTEAIVIESRRRIGYDSTIGREGEGALVYKVDTSFRFGENSGKSSSYVLAPERNYSRDMRFSSPLKVGESVNYKNVKITVVEAGEFGDVVSIEKI